MSTYSFLNVQASLAGPGGLLNLGQGAAAAAEGITVARAGDRNKMTIGADGNGMNTLIADKSGQVTVRLLKTSPQNAALMAHVQRAAAELRRPGAKTSSRSRSPASATFTRAVNARSRKSRT
jgi:hypothetical protein